MASGINKIILLGNLGQDPELSHTKDGTAYATFSLATDESYKNSNGEKIEKVSWHKCVVWKKLAEICQQYLLRSMFFFILAIL